MATYTYRSARSKPLLIGISIALAVETFALHMLLWQRRHPYVAWTLTALSILTILWIVRDYVAMGEGAIHLDERELHLTVGRRVNVRVPRTQISQVITPTFRDLPTPGTNQGVDFLNPTKPATPNVLLTLREPMTVRLPGRRRTIRRIALHLDEPAAFIAAVSVLVRQEFNS